MNAERLLQYFERIAEAPGAVPQLRQFILDLAVRGKLVEQDPKDEPALELLKQIASELEEVPFEFPAKWMSAKAGRLLNIRYGKALPASDRGDEGSVPVFGSNGVVGYCETALTDEPAIIIGRKGSAGALNLCDGPSWTTDVAYYLMPPAFFNIRFLLVVFQTLHLGSLGKGVKPGLSRSEVYQLTIVVPPLAEQHRIVATVDELMGLCDELEAAQQKRERRRDRLVAATLHSLNNGTSGEDRSQNARFYFNHLPRLTTRPEHIQQLRQTILNLAVRGELVPQEQKDEPVSTLLERIADEQHNLFEQGLLKKRSVLCDPKNQEAPHAIPGEWHWECLGKLISFGPQNGISPKPTNNEQAPKALTLTATTSGFFDPSHYKHVELTEAASENYWLSSGDVLFQRGNTREYVGIAAVFNGPERSFVFPDLMIRVRFSESLHLRFVHMALISPPLRKYFAAQATGASSSMPKISQGVLLNTPIPLPPLLEQQRIVAKVDELMAVCDELEARLTASTSTRSRLLEAVLHEALARHL